jgi:hypothetical protein
MQVTLIFMLMTGIVAFWRLARETVVVAGVVGGAALLIFPGYLRLRNFVWLYLYSLAATLRRRINV